MNKPKVKICGIKEIKTIDVCIYNEIEYFGLVFYKNSPRNLSLDHALKLINYVISKDIIPVGVFVNKSIQDLKDIIKQTNLKHIQLHGDEDADYINLLKKKFEVKIIKSVGIKNKDDFDKIKKVLNADYFLFDYKPEISELPGGNARKFNWSLLKNVKISKPYFISGGINVNNVREIKKIIIPYGIDISSGVEEKLGIKSNKKITKLLEMFNAQ